MAAFAFLFAILHLLRTVEKIILWYTCQVKGHGQICIVSVVVTGRKTDVVVPAALADARLRGLWLVRNNRYPNGEDAKFFCAFLSPVGFYRYRFTSFLPAFICAVSGYSGLFIV